MCGAASVLDGVLGDELDDALGNGTLIEGIPGGLDAGHPALVSVLFVCVTHRLQSVREIRIAQHLAQLGWATIGVVDRTGGRVERGKLTKVRPQAVVQTLIDRKPLCGQLDGWLNLFGEGFASEIAQGHEACVHHAWNQRGHDAGHWNDALQPARVKRQYLARLRPPLPE